MKHIFILTLSLLFSAAAFTQLRTANIFTSHMVLQRDKIIPVWGWANKNEKITVQFNGQTVSAKANSEGKWIISLKPIPAGGPYDMNITTKKESVVLTDIMVGEVWICSGQSNMEWTVQNVNNAKDEIASAVNIPIRQFKVATQVALQPLDDITKGEWVAASPETVGNFTAVGYFFARKLAEQLHVTIGLINDSWGGSQVESWISKDAMLGSDALKDYAQNHLPSTWQQADSIMQINLKKNLSAKNNNQLPVYNKQQLLQADTSLFNTWLPYNAPGQWDWQGVWAFRGTGYYERTIDITAKQANEPAVLSLGDNDGAFELYINGSLVKQGEGKQTFNLPAQTFKAGKNILLLRQAKRTEPSWYGNGLSGDPSRLYLHLSDATVSLAGSGWKIFPDFEAPFTFNHGANNHGTIIYNAMIHPIIPYAVKGVIWYQGEANAGRAYQYRKTFPLLIESWRNEWKDDFPFLFVQLSSFGNQQSSNEGSDWAELREAQTMTLSLPNTGMAVTTDIGNANDIHPRNKQDVGKRLAATALNKVYGMDTVLPSGPMYKSSTFNNGKAYISFDYVRKGLMAKDKYGYIRGFEIAGADKKFYYAQASIDGDKVIVWSDKVMQPVAVRYAWANAPVDASLFNVEGFPASPFRTDTWPGITEGKKFE